jgi:hypothetical protein
MAHTRKSFRSGSVVRFEWKPTMKSKPKVKEGKIESEYDYLTPKKKDEIRVWNEKERKIYIIKKKDIVERLKW